MPFFVHKRWLVHQRQKAKQETSNFFGIPNLRLRKAAETSFMLLILQVVLGVCQDNHTFAKKKACGEGQPGDGIEKLRFSRMTKTK